MLTPKNRAVLKSMANHLKPQVTLGKGEVDENILSAIANSLEAHELIKVKVLQNSNEDIHAISEQIILGTDSFLVDIIGRIIILYRPSKKHPRNLI